MKLQHCIYVCFMLIFASCAGTNPEIRISSYTFGYLDQKFRIRSVNCETGATCYNELIGTEFLAVDYDQDGIIDQVRMGGTDLAKAQKVYEYGLQLLASEGKLSEQRSSVSSYKITDSGAVYEIKSFNLEKSEVFNEFVLYENQISAIVAIDKNADGRLDSVIKGTAGLDFLQEKYDMVIETGLAAGGLLRKDGMVFVKK